MPWIRSGSATISLTVMRGFSDAYGSWKTIWISRRTGRIGAAVERGDVAAVEDDRARGRLDQPDDRPAERRLAAARLADDAEGLALRDGQIDAVDGAHRPDRVLEDAGLDREVLDQALDAEQGVVVAHRVWRGALEPLAGPSVIDPSVIAASSRAAAPATTCASASSSAKWQRVSWTAPSPIWRRAGMSVRQTQPALRERAARVERTAGRRRDQARRLARDRLEPLLFARRAGRGCSSARRCTGGAAR